MPDHVSLVAAELGVGSQQVLATVELLNEGATVPFISRYRKEATGSLDEVAVAGIRDRMAQLAELDRRRDTILASLRERELLDEELQARIGAAGTLTVLEDIYLPYRPKRRTRAMVARERGLEPLAKSLMDQREGQIDVTEFIDPAGGVEDRDAALAGARDIIAEEVSESPEVRSELRSLFSQGAVLSSSVVKKKQDEEAKKAAEAKE